MSSGTLANPCFPLQRDYLFTFHVESTSYSNLNYSLVGKHHVVGKDTSIYGHSNIFDHELLLLTIIYMINKLGGETLSPYLPLCLIDVVCSKNMLWVPEIIEDYMMIEYVELLLRICWISLIGIAWWLRT